MSDSYGWTIMLIAVVFAGILFTSLSIGVNYMTDMVNLGIEGGTLTEQTASNYSNVLSLWMLLPLFVLIDIMLWAFNRSNQGEV